MIKKKTVTKFKTRNRQGKRYMICRNSIEDKKYWGWTLLSKYPRCNKWIEVQEGSTGVLCSECVQKTVEPPNIKGGYKSTGRLRGWQFMHEFVDKDGNVFYKGKEQPKLKSTLPTTEPKPKKKKLSKHEKDQLRIDILQQMAMVRGELKTGKWKKDIKSSSIHMRKLERQLKKL